MAKTIPLGRYTLTFDGSDHAKILTQHIAECERVLQDYQQWQGDDKHSPLRPLSGRLNGEVEQCEY